MGAFAREVARWHDFYMLIGPASATLAGLLFIAFSLHLDKVVGEGHRGLQAMAGQTFSGFLAVLVVALFFLVRGQGSQGIGWPLLITGGQGVVRNVFGALFVASGPSESRIARVHPFWTFIGPTACYAAMIVVSVFWFLGRTDALYWLIAVLCTLIVVATGGAWTLRVPVGRRGNAASRRVPPKLREICRRSRVGFPSSDGTAATSSGNRCCRRA